MTTDDIKDCCKIEANLVSTQINEELLVKVCQVCGCRHFEVTLDKGSLGAVGSTL